MRYVMKVSYVGTMYNGFQIQPQGDTIAGELNRCLGIILRCDVSVTGSGRTDAGVHALGQVVHFDAPECDCARLVRSMNGLLPADIRVLSCEPRDIHARYDAKRKTYKYMFYLADEELPMCHDRMLRVDRAVNVDAMRECCQVLVGTHDFRNFCASGSQATTFDRTIYECRIDCVGSESFGDFYTLSVTGDGFLYKMVRNIMGLLLAVGLGKVDIAQFTARAFGDAKFVQPAPPHGLYLYEVEY